MSGSGSLPPEPTTPRTGGTGVERTSEIRSSSDWARVEALAALLEPEAFNPDQPADEKWRERTKDTALAYAAQVVATGWVKAPTPQAVKIEALEEALEASRDHARRARREGLDEDTCRFWSGTSGWLRSRIRALSAGEEPDWPDAATYQSAALRGEEP